MKDSIFFKQANLLLRVLPIINEHKVFALKGGTAINFFVRDLPRLSVDIDLTYLVISPRNESLTDITTKLNEICSSIERKIHGTVIHRKYLSGTKFISGIIINNSGTTIKIEPNTVIRGSVNKPQLNSLCKKGEDLFELSLKVQCLSIEDLYGGKICATLDRQHPRDLYDVKLLFENEGLNENIVRAFIFYLISHDRPIVEVLNPNLLDIKQIFENEFIGMVERKISIEELLNTRQKLIFAVRNLLSEEQKYFLLSFKNKKPEWNLSGIQNIEKFPSVKWKLLNLEKMSTQRHRRAYDKLKEYLLS
jgi:predicted nucleotidyltransferase component of viral defense system